MLMFAPNFPSGFCQLVRSILRRDRFWLPLWMLGCLTLATFFAPLLPDMAGSEHDMAILYEAMKNPAMIAICGILYGDSYTYGVMYSQFMLVWSAALVAAMNILFVARHTRRDEEEGRLEMLAALPVGKSANLLAVLVLSLALNLLIALLTGALLAAFAIEGMGTAGSLLFGAALGVCGFSFATLTALLAQLVTSFRATIGLAFAALGASYLLRASGDVSSEALALLSPLGLIERCHLFADDRLWPLLLLLAISLVLAGASLAINAWRDYAAGLIAPRAGRAHAPALLRGPLSLAWRLTRNMILAWILVVFLFAASFGSMFGDMTLFYESNDLYSLMIGSTGVTTGDLMDPVIAMLFLVMSLIATVPVVFTLFRIRTEERRGRLEHFYSGAV